MKRTRLHLCTTLSASLLLGLGAPRLWACAACFGKSDSAMAKGMNMGILTLLGVVVAMLSVLTSFFVFLARKGAKVNGSSERPEQAIDSQT